jgi:hypothetical protein
LNISKSLVEMQGGRIWFDSEFSKGTTFHFTVPVAEGIICMALKVSIGQAQALNGREAGLQATHHALNRLGSSTPALGFVIAAHQYQAREVVSGVSGLLGDTPMIGFSSSACLSSNGLHHNSVMVALLAGDFQAETRWMPGYAQSGRETGAQLSKQAAEQNDPRALFFFADGFNGDADQLCNCHLEYDFPPWWARSLQATYIRVNPTRSRVHKLGLGPSARVSTR